MLINCYDIKIKVYLNQDNRNEYKMQNRLN